jgi:hypothetical protein
MNPSVVVGVISAAAVSYYFTKKKDREADWRKYKFEQYKEFLASMSGSLGRDSTQEGRIGFAKACNTLYLIGSPGVLTALHEFQNELGIPASIRFLDKHDVLLSRLVWEIRKDIDIPGTPKEAEFAVHLRSPSTDVTE